MFAKAFMQPQKRHKTKPINLITGTCLIILILFLASLALGSVSISLTELYHLLLGKEENPAHAAILWEARLPRSVTALSTGAALALSGLLMQTLFRNPLAGPSVLGISGGSSLMVAVLLMTSSAVGMQLGALSFSLITALAAGIGAIAVLLIILAISRQFKEQYSLLLSGIMIGYLLGALESILQFQSTSEALKSYILWGMGSFSHATWLAIGIISMVTLIGFAFAWANRHSLNLFLMGDQQAQLLGLSVKHFQLRLILLSGILVAVATAFCGPIGFIGLVSPHLVRLILREADHRKIMPATLLMGGALALLADLVSRMYAIPVNAITALIGAPVVLFVIFNQRKG